MADKLKVGDRVLHVSGANVKGFENQEGEILKVSPRHFSDDRTAYVVAFKYRDCATLAEVWCYAWPPDDVELNLQLLHPLQGENG